MPPGSSTWRTILQHIFVTVDVAPGDCRGWKWLDIVGVIENLCLTKTCMGMFIAALFIIT